MSFRCPSCGATLPGRAAFCRQCGKRLNSAVLRDEPDEETKAEIEMYEISLSRSREEYREEKEKYERWRNVTVFFSIVSALVCSISVILLPSAQTAGALCTAIISFAVFLGEIIGFLIWRGNGIEHIEHLQMDIEDKRRTISELKKSIFLE